MEMSAAGLDLLKRSEGFRSHTYLDAAGIATIGYGHQLLPKEFFPNGVTEAHAEEILLSDLRGAEQAVQRLVRAALTQGQFDALVDFTFNVGAGKLASSTLLKVLNAGKYDAARKQLLRWDHVGLQENAGLEARREAEFQLWGSGGAERQAGA
ncbi:MAG: lysozyme [Terracidiphilus sp.]|jgi:lysozyme